MDGDGQNYSVFNSRMLVDTVGDITDDALKASRIKDVIGVLVGRVFNWSQRKSLFPLHLGIKCCALEMAAAGASRFDAERFGVFFRSSPRQCDVLLVNGPISKKFADPIVRLWEQMPEPKWCIAMGECAISGGPYFQSYNILEGVDTVIPVDVYIPGCPPRPEAVLHALMDIQEQIRNTYSVMKDYDQGDRQTPATPARPLVLSGEGTRVISPDTLYHQDA